MLGDPWCFIGLYSFKISEDYMNSKGATLTKATYFEWQASLFGACFISFGLGVLVSKYFQPYSLIIILIGILMHSWGMYKIHRRDKKNR